MKIKGFLIIGASCVLVGLSQNVKAESIIDSGMQNNGITNIEQSQVTADDAKAFFGNVWGKVKGATDMVVEGTVSGVKAVGGGIGKGLRAAGEGLQELSGVKEEEMVYVEKSDLEGPVVSKASALNKVDDVRQKSSSVKRKSANTRTVGN